MVEIETRSRIPTERTFRRIQGHVIPEPPATLQGTATCHDFRVTCHIAGCCYLANSMTCHPSARCQFAGYRPTATWWIHCHDPRATCDIAGCKNSMRHIEDRFSPYSIFFVFLMQFGLWRVAAFVSSPIHLLQTRRKQHMLTNLRQFHHASWQVWLCW